MTSVSFEGVRLRMVRLGLVLAVAAGMWLSLGSVSALASAEPHPFLFSFGSFSNPNGIAIEQSSGDVYVADIGTDAVYKFDADGNPVNFSGLGSNVLTGADTPAGSFSFPAVQGNPAALAIDDSTRPSDPSAGDLYVMDAGHKVIDKFSPSGAYLGQITGPFSAEAVELLGLGVDSSGEVRVFYYAEGKGQVKVFDNSAVNSYVTRQEGNVPEPGLPASAFAVAPATGDDYLLFSSCGCVRKFGGALDELGQVDSTFSDVAAAVDPATGELYIDDQSSVSEWDTGNMNGTKLTPSNAHEYVSTGSLVSSFGSSQLSTSMDEGGIAVDGASGDVYVSNPANGKVYVFGTDVPGVESDAAVSVTKTSATLQGTVDPHGVPVTSCQFEYEASEVDSYHTLTIPATVFGQSVPCDLTPAQIGSGTGALQVTADVSGLVPGRLYDFRLVAGNTNGTSPSGGRFATAGPGFGVKTFEVAFLNQNGTPDTQAGSHPYKMVTNIALNTTVRQVQPFADSQYVTLPDEDVRDIITDLPPGLVGDPNATPVKCTLEQLEGARGENGGGGHCPAESIVGELEVEFGNTGNAFPPILEPVYNMVAPRGVAVQIGANFIIPKSYVDAGLLAGGDYPVQASVFSIPTIEPIVTTRLTVFGVVGSDTSQGEFQGGSDTRRPFLTLPTGCTGPLKSTIAIDSYQKPGDFVEASSLTRDAGGEPLALTGCSKLLFPPTITVAPDTTDASTSSGLTVGVHISQKAALNPEGLAESALRDTTVTLPEGVALNPAGADGLEACSEGLAGFTGFAEFNSEFEPGVKTATFTPGMPKLVEPGSNFCPNGSKIGTVQVTTPLLSNPLEGAVYLAAQNANPFGSLVAMYLIMEDPVSGSLVKLTGEVRLSETGQIVTTFKNTPDLPFEELQLHFFGGERAPLTTPSRCGTYTTQAVFTPWDGNGAVTATSSFAIEHGPNGSPCPGASLPFDPSLTAGTTSIQAGGFSPFTMTMSREDGQQSLQAISLHMPAGLSGLLSGVKLCGEAQADAGTCGPESEIGETIVSVGVGSDPFSVKGGKVYITGPYEGAPFGLSIVNPAVAGPFDLGKVVVRAKIEVNPLTAALTITSDDSGPYKIPQYIDGIPLQIKHVNVTINRPGFTFNPTNCDKMEISGSLSSTEGATNALSVPFQATNCATLAFAPKFAVSTSGKTSKANGASLSVKLSYPAGSLGSQANIHLVKVELPRQLPSRLTTLRKACVAAVFEADPADCPAASIIGHAAASTPLLPVVLEGPAYFVSHGGEAFPSLIVVLQGDGVTIDLVGTTFISKAGITSSTFKTVPDAPVGSFELNLPAGPFSALTANGKSLCGSKLAMPTEFVAQNGAEIHQSTKIAVSGCAKAKQKAAHKKQAKGKGKEAKRGGKKVV